MRRVIPRMIALLLAVLLVIPMPAAASKNAASEAREGVVRILAITEIKNGTIYYSTGSGLGVGEEGEHTTIFITNNHVIDEAEQIYILLDNDWEKSVPEFGGTEDSRHAVRCEVVFTPENSHDYAILEASREIDERVSLPLMHADQAEPGESIFALGYPGVADGVTDSVAADIDDITITSGTISRFTFFEATKSDAIQIDADINHGNSGGPLITEEGYVIGLNTWGVSDDDGAEVHLAIQIDYVIEKLDELIEDEVLEDFTYTVIEDRNEVHKDYNMTIILAAAGALVILIIVIVVVSKRRRNVVSAPVYESKEKVSDADTAKIQPKEDVPNNGVQVNYVNAGGPPPGFDDIQKTIPADNAVKGHHKVHEVHQVQQAQFCLVGMSGVHAGRKVPVSRDMLLGRNPSADLSYPSGTPGVSGSHCIVSPRPNGIVVIDQGSTHGTFTATGMKLNAGQKYLLHSGDVFMLANKDQSFKVLSLDAARNAGASAAFSQPSSGLYLAGHSGPLTGKRYSLNKAIRIGRSSSNDVVFPEGTPGISGSHCILVPQADCVLLSDAGSTYGTYLSNGTKLVPQTQYPLHKGDVFYLADKSQSFRIE